MKSTDATIDTDRLNHLAQGRGILLEENQLAQLKRYAELLLNWNTRMNLTAITEPQEMEMKHFLDCLIPAGRKEVRGRVADVGTGAGFPGVVLKIARPEIELTLMEPSKKRCTFLAELLRELGIDAAIVRERAEEAGRKGYREQYDLVTARAVAALPMLAEYCLPLVRPGGCFMAMKGDVHAELAEAATAIHKLGGAEPQLLEYSLPDGAARSLVLVKKASSTPAVYPRNGGVIVKRPL